MARHRATAHARAWVEGAALRRPLLAVCDQHALSAQHGQQVPVARGLGVVVALKHELDGPGVCDHHHGRAAGHLAGSGRARARGARKGRVCKGRVCKGRACKGRACKGHVQGARVQGARAACVRGWRNTHGLAQRPLRFDQAAAAHARACSRARACANVANSSARAEWGHLLRSLAPRHPPPTPLHTTAACLELEEWPILLRPLAHEALKVGAARERHGHRQRVPQAQPLGRARRLRGGARR
jgi:hypothetical protein